MLTLTGALKSGTRLRARKEACLFIDTGEKLDGMESSQIHFRAEFTIEEAKIEEYKELVQNMSRLVEANEPDTIEYKFYLSRDETRCIVHEAYTDSKAVLAHNNGIASQTILPKIFNIAKINRLDVYGNLGEVCLHRDNYHRHVTNQSHSYGNAAFLNNIAPCCNFARRWLSTVVIVHTK